MRHACGAPERSLQYRSDPALREKAVSGGLGIQQFDLAGSVKRVSSNSVAGSRKRLASVGKTGNCA
jgi:hypothetical protein